MAELPRLQARIQGIRGLKGDSNVVSVEEFVLTSNDGQTDITFPSGKEYTPGNKSLFIFVDGLPFARTKYLELDPNTVRLITPLAAGKEVLVKYINYVQAEDALKEVIVQDTEPTQINTDIRDGLIWFNPSTKTFAVYSESEQFFIEVAFRRDFDSSTVIIPMDGGTF